MSDGPDDEVLRARIVRRLALFGAGPAAMFRDACALMDGDPMVASEAHLVGHLVRELESSLRAALVPPGTPARREPPARAVTQAPARGRMGAAAQALGRLARELAELIRALFLPPARRSAQTAADTATASSAPAMHRLEVRAVLDSLGIAYDSDAGKTWLAYAALPHTWPPWQGPGAPRPVDQEFRRSFVNLLAMLDVVLERHEARYLASVDRLDALARAARPGDEHASELRQEFPQDPVTLGRFFSQLTSPAWIRPLRKQGFFAIPPAPLAGAGGPGWQPEWPALRYLVRVAHADPALATEVAAEIPATDNQLVNACLVNLALEVPAEQSVKLVPRVTADLANWPRDGYEAERAEPPSALVLHLADGGMPEAALGLARTLWGFSASPEEEDALPGAVGGLRTRIAASDYAESLRTCLSPLAAGCGPAVLGVVADLLDEAISRTASPAMIESRQDLSTFWRPAVEGRPADIAMDARTALVSAVRDAAAQLVGTGADMEEVLRRLDRHDWPIFRRLALHLLRQFGDGCKQEVAAWLTDPVAISDPYAEREYLLLARDHFTTLTGEDRQRVLHLIDQGPDVSRWAGSYAAEVGQEPSADMVDRWVAEWARDRLGAIETALPEHTRDSYRQLVRLVGEPAPAGRTRAAARFIREVTGSPASSGLAGCSVDSVVSFLRSRPPAAPAPTPDAAPIVIRSATPAAAGPAAEHAMGAAGPLASSSVFDLAQELGHAVRASPLRYSAAARCFAGLAAPYVAQVLSGLAAAADDGADLDWESTLELCRWVSATAAGGERRRAAQPEGAGGRRGARPGGAGGGRAAPPEEAGCRREVIALLRAGLNHVPAVIPIGERVQVWHLIEASLSDDGPVAGESADGPAAAEHLCAGERAEALAAAVSYAMWVRRHQRDCDLAEVFFRLDRHLDPAAERLLAVHAVYGAEFHRLAQLNDAWAAGAASRIFPSSEADRELWEAAWDAYLDPLVPITSDACTLLSDQYRLAVDRLGTGGDGPGRRDVRLGHHLITRYLAGEISLGGDRGYLIDAFYARASTAVRAEMTRYLGWQLLDPGTRTDADVLFRLTQLWEKRLATASPSADKDEMVWFGDWFASGRFDAGWSLRQLARVITLTGEAKPDILVLRRLAEIAPTRPQLCLDIVDEWIRQLPDDAWLLSVREEYLGRILAAGLASPDAATKARAQEITNEAVRRGHTRFRDLVLTGATGPAASP